MKTTLYAMIALMVVAVAFVGCGKSEAEKKVEQELSTAVTKLHDEGMKIMKEIPELTGKVDLAVAAHDSLAKLYPKQTEGHSAVDLTAAKEKLAAASASMEKWMKEAKKYTPEMKHADALALLNQQKTELGKITGEATAAVDAAKTALASHAQYAQDLLAKLPAKKKK
jgi:paraquat-inducible protein B